MNVCMRCLYYLSIVDVSERNGQGVYALETLKALLRLGERPTFVCPRPKRPDELDRLRDEYGFQVAYLSPKRRARSALWHLLVQFQLFYRLLSAPRPMVLLYSLKPSMVAPLIYAKMSGASVYLQVEGLIPATVRTVMGPWLAAIGRRIVRWNLRAARKVYPAYAAASEWVSSEIQEQSRIQIQPCGVDFQLFSIGAARRPTSSLTIGYVGSFRPNHLLRQLLQATADLDVVLRLAGDGAEREPLEEMRRKEGRERVHFSGTIDRSGVPSYYAGCDVVWAATSPNHWGIPIKAYEGLAMNKKVIVTRRSEFRFIEERGYGFTIERGTEDEIRELITRLIKMNRHGDLYDNVDSREHIRLEHSWDRMAETIVHAMAHDR